MPKVQIIKTLPYINRDISPDVIKLQPGDIVEEEERFTNGWIKEGYAVAVAEDAPKAVEPETTEGEPEAPKARKTKARKPSAKK